MIRNDAAMSAIDACFSQHGNPAAKAGPHRPFVSAETLKKLAAAVKSVQAETLAALEQSLSHEQTKALDTLEASLRRLSQYSDQSLAQTKARLDFSKAVEALSSLIPANITTNYLTEKPKNIIQSTLQDLLKHVQAEMSASGHTSDLVSLINNTGLLQDALKTALPILVLTIKQIHSEKEANISFDTIATVAGSHLLEVAPGAKELVSILDGFGKAILAMGTQTSKGTAEQASMDLPTLVDSIFTQAKDALPFLGAVLPQIQEHVVALARWISPRNAEPTQQQQAQQTPKTSAA